VTGDEILALDAVAIAEAVRGGRLRAREVAEASLAAITARDEELNCFTRVLEDEALAAADAVDRRVAAGEDAGPLAGVPFAAKNLFDIAGVTTLAGSKILAGNAPAERDATVVARLRAAGAVLVGATNMDEFAYGFVTENAHYGVTRNPHDRARVAGGSSGGSAAAVAAGMVPLALGSDTNGSIRVPAAFCGVYGLKPTYGRVSRAGAFLFAASLDHVGPFARSVRDLAVVFDVLQGPDQRDPVCSRRLVELVAGELGWGASGLSSRRLRVGVLGGYFGPDRGGGGQPEVFAAVERVARAVGASEVVEIEGVELARTAAFLITAVEGGNLHLDRLRTRPGDFDPAVVERLMAGALAPAGWYVQAQRYRRVFQERVRRVFERFDVLLAPATPCPAIRIGQKTIEFDGQEIPARANLGMYTQPISFIGLPVVTVPVVEDGKLPVGVQVIGAPYKEGLAIQAGLAVQANAPSAPVGGL
jgi:AtzE family amidohydrolase